MLYSSELSEKQKKEENTQKPYFDLKFVGDDSILVLINCDVVLTLYHLVNKTFTRLKTFMS